MATTIAQLVATLSADTRAFKRDLAGAETGMQKTARTIHKSAMFAGGAIVAGLGIAAKIGWDEFAEGQKVAAQTNAVLKSTGGVAHVTAKHLDEMSQSMLKKTGIDDEAIRIGGNMLLTFKNIRNEVGKGNDIFDQTTQAMNNMATSMNQGSVPSADQLQKTAIRLGKAMNDPIKGVTALTKVGVTFSEGQKETIKRMVESGNTMGAQKLILRELNSEFAGSAEAAGKTLPGQLKILRESFSDLAGQGVGLVIPKLLALTGFMKDHITTVKAVGVALAGVVTILLATSAALKVVAAATAVATAAQAAYTAAHFVHGFIELAMGVRSVRDAWILLNLAMIANPIGTVIAVVVLLGAALVLAYKKSETFRTIVSAAFNTVRNIVLGVISNILGSIDNFLGGLQYVMEAASHLPGVGDKFKGIAEKIGDAREQVRGLRDNINELHGKEIKITVNAGINVAGMELRPGDVFGPIAGHAKGAMVKATKGGVFMVAEGGYDEAVLSTDPKHKKRTYKLMSEVTRRLEGRRNILPGFAEGGFTMGQVGRAVSGMDEKAIRMSRLAVQFMAQGMPPAIAYAEARRMESLHRPYLWGGGHAGFSANGPWDCSGAVSQVLHKAGLLGGSPQVSGALMNWGRAGHSDRLEVSANAGHVFMKILGKGFGTSNENPGGGFGDLSYGNRSGFAVRTYAKGGFVKAGRTISPTTEKRARGTMRWMWENLAKQFFPGQNMPGIHLGDTGSNRFGYVPFLGGPGGRTVRLSADAFAMAAGDAASQHQFRTGFLHEIAHAFQPMRTIRRGKAFAEGGADIFATLADNFAGTSPDEGWFYPNYSRDIFKRLGRNWGLRGQFASYDRGGFLPPGLSMAYNGTGRPEPVGGGLTVNFNGPVFGGRRGLEEITEAVERAFTKRRRDGGTLGFTG